MTLFQKIKDPVIYIWSKFGLFLNRLFTPLILGCIYFIVLTPVALLYRLTKRKKPTDSTSFIGRNKTFTAKDFENPW